MKRGTATVSVDGARASRAAVRLQGDAHGDASSPTPSSSISSRPIARAGRTVAFANGCFDLLHVGHVRYLEGARREADRLIVAVNDDDVGAAPEGAGPADPAGRRRAPSSWPRCAASTTSCCFRDPTVERLLRLLRPDVHCKGTDYTVETVPEREVVRAYGGRVAIVGDPKDHSTRDAARRAWQRRGPGPGGRSARSSGR